MLFTGATGRRGRLLMALLATTWASALLTWAAADGAAAGAEAALAAAAGSAAVAFQVTAETDGGAAAAPAVTRSDRAVTITAPGTYRLRGLLDGAALVVDSRVPGAVRLVLDGVRVQPAAGPALEVRAADAVLLELAPGSFNSLLAPDHDGAASPAVRSAAPLRLRGGGHLLAMARRGHGLESAARLAFEGGVVTLIAGRDGARAASLGALVVGVLVALWGSLRAFVGIQTALDDCWEVDIDDRANAALKRAKALIGVFVIGIGQVSGVILAAIVSHAGLPLEGQALVVAGTAVLNFAMVLIMYRFLTSKTVSWSMIWRGAALCGVLYTALQLVGTLVMTLGGLGVNMANFSLGRAGTGGDAIAITYLDAPLREDVREALLATGKFEQVRALRFEV